MLPLSPGHHLAPTRNLKQERAKLSKRAISFLSFSRFALPADLQISRDTDIERERDAFDSFPDESVHPDKLKAITFVTIYRSEIEIKSAIAEHATIKNNSLKTFQMM